MAEKKKEAKAEDFNFGDWLEEGFEGLRRKIEEKREGKRPRFFPEEFVKHTRASRKEMLLAVRSLFDTAIEELEKEPESSQKAT